MTKLIVSIAFYAVAAGVAAVLLYQAAPVWGFLGAVAVGGVIGAWRYLKA